SDLDDLDLSRHDVEVLVFDQPVDAQLRRLISNVEFDFRMRLIHVRRIADKQEVRKQVDRDEYGQDPEPVVPDDRPQLAEVDPFDCIAGLKRSCLHDRELFLLLLTMISVTMLAIMLMSGP